MFQKGNKHAAAKKGRVYTKSRMLNILEKLNQVEHLSDLTLKAFYEGLTDKNKSVRLMTANNVAKYLFPTKKESLNVDLPFEKFLEQIQQQKALKESEANNEKAQLQQISSVEAVIVIPDIIEIVSPGGAEVSEITEKTLDNMENKAEL